MGKEEEKGRVKYKYKGCYSSWAVPGAETFSEISISSQGMDWLEEKREEIYWKQHNSSSTAMRKRRRLDWRGFK